MRTFVLALGLLAGADGCRPSATRPAARDESESVAQLRAMHVDGARIPAGETELARAIETLADPWTRRYSRGTAQALLADVGGTATAGVGLPELLSIDLDARGTAFEVVAPAPGSAAARAGLLPHDRIVAIDGRPARPADYHAVIAGLRKPTGATVQLEIVRAAERYDVALLVESTRPAMPVQTEHDGKVLVVRFGPFGPASAEAFRAVLAHEKPIALRLDLRGHTGGQLDAVLAIAGALVGETEAVELVLADRREPVRTQGPIVYDAAIEVRIDAGTASAAEVLTAILRSSARVRVVGETSFGKCLVHAVMPLADDGLVLVTSARLAERGSSPWCGRGLEPARL